MRDDAVVVRAGDAPGATRLTVAIGFVPPFQPPGRALDRLVCDRVILASQRQSLARLTAIVKDVVSQ